MPMHSLSPLSVQLPGFSQRCALSSLFSFPLLSTPVFPSSSLPYHRMRSLCYLCYAECHCFASLARIAFRRALFSAHLWPLCRVHSSFSLVSSLHKFLCVFFPVAFDSSFQLFFENSFPFLDSSTARSNRSDGFVVCQSCLSFTSHSLTNFYLIYFLHIHTAGPSSLCFFLTSTVDNLPCVFLFILREIAHCMAA